MFNPAELQAAVNGPEVHAAVIQAATKVVLSAQLEPSRMSEHDAASSIAMNAAMILRSYLDFLGRKELPNSPNSFDA